MKVYEQKCTCAPGSNRSDIRFYRKNVLQRLESFVETKIEVQRLEF